MLYGMLEMPKAKMVIKMAILNFAIFNMANHVAMGLYQLLVSGIILVINQKFFVNGFKGLLHRSPNMDTLVALGAAASFY